MDTTKEFPGRFAVMRITQYYPLGGMADCVSKHATIEEAQERAESERRRSGEEVEIADLLEEARTTRI